MINLQPLKAYTDSVAGMWTRQGWVAGAVVGAVIAIGVGWAVAPSGTAATIATVGSAWVVGGGFIGLFWPRSMARSWRTMTERVYEGKPPFEVDAPSGGYTHRLPASLRTSDRVAVGGVLFVGPDTIAFVPHTMNVPVHRRTIVLPVSDGFIIDTIPQRSTIIRRLWFGVLPPLVRMTSGDERWLFVVPLPQDTVGRIRDVVKGRSCSPSKGSTRIAPG